MGKKINFFIATVILTAFFLFSFNSLTYAQQEEVGEALEECNQAVVSITAYDSNKKEIGQGRGVLISSDGLVLTNYHLISQASSAKVFQAKKSKIRKKVDWEDVFYPSFERTDEPQKKKVKRKGKWIDVEGVVSVDKNLDLALIKIEKKGYPASPLASSDIFTIGDKVFIVIDEESISEGSITGLKEFAGEKRIVQINLPLSLDMSGSPLFNSKGEIIGIASHIADKLDIILPGSYAHPLVKDEKATPLAKSASEDYFGTWEGLYFKGRAYSLNENFTEAMRLFEESLRKNPDYPHTHSQMGFINSKLNLYEKAVDSYSKAISMNPNDYKAAFGLGIAYVRLNQPQQAIEPFTQCTSINPEFPDAFYNLGLAYETLEQLEGAAKAYQKFIKINPGPAWTGHSQLGTIYVKMGKYNEAITSFQEVIKSNPSDLKATYNMAYSYDMSGQYDQAASLYKKLTNLNPKDAKAYYGLLFRLYDKAEQYENAIEAGQEIIKLAPDDPNNHYNLGIIYNKQDNYEKALEALHHALSLDQNFDPAYYNIGLVHFKQKKYAEAVKAFTKFTELKSDQPDAYYNIGAGYLQIKKYEEAIKPLQKAVELKPDYDVAHYNLAIAFYAVGDHFSANEEYKTLKNMNPDLAQKLSKIIHK